MFKNTTMLVRKLDSHKRYLLGLPTRVYFMIDSAMNVAVQKANEANAKV